MVEENAQTTTRHLTTARVEDLVNFLLNGNLSLPIHWGRECHNPVPGAGRCAYKLLHKIDGFQDVTLS
jgi:hypothetical protein